MPKDYGRRLLQPVDWQMRADVLIHGRCGGEISTDLNKPNQGARCDRCGKTWVRKDRRCSWRPVP